MKRYSDYKSGAVSMKCDNLFEKIITAILKELQTSVIIESGTYNGLGSTKTIAEIIRKNNFKCEAFYTIEADEYFYNKAVKNLGEYDFVIPVHGLSVKFDEAKKFIESDDAILNHERYPDFFIDDTENPVLFYLNEISGKLSETVVTRKKESVAAVNKTEENRKIFFPEENILPFLLEKHKEQKPLVNLDSAGGVGYIEFCKTTQSMKGKDFFLVLDDIHHLKHFRSYKEITENKKFELLGMNYDDGWLIAKCNA